MMGRRLRLSLALLMSVLLAFTVTRAMGAVGQPAKAQAATVRGNTWYLRFGLASGSYIQFQYGLATDRKVIGDWNGGGTRHPGVFRNGVWYLRNFNSGGLGNLVFSYGRGGDIPVVGDWNGDGIDTVGIFRNGVWYLRNANSAGPANLVFSYGRGGDIPVVGDWNGDGIDTIGAVRSGVWYQRDSNSGGPSNRVLAYGLASDVPVVGDWNADGVDTVGVYRSGTWYLRDSNSSGASSQQVFAFGAPDDVPLVWKQVVTTVPPSLVGQEWTVLPTTRKVVALTFDAGGNADGVASILGTLNQTGAVGTFFLTGRWAESFPSYASQIGSRYPVGNHTYSHPHLPQLSDAAVKDEVTLGASRVSGVTGQETRPLFRFPYGESDARTLALVNSLSFGSYRWTVDTLGWEGTSGGQSVSSVVARVLAGLRPGEIVLMHVGSNPTDHSTLDANALPTIISELRRRGYELVTLRQYS